MIELEALTAGPPMTISSFQKEEEEEEKMLVLLLSMCRLCQRARQWPQRMRPPVTLL